MNKEQLAKDYANRNFESTTYHYTDDKRLTDFEKIKKTYIEGYEKAETKWISVEEQTPEDGKAVLVKTKDYRRPQYDVTDVQIGYLENEVWYYNEGGEINSGLGWHLTHWMEIPK